LTITISASPSLVGRAPAGIGSWRVAAGHPHPAAAVTATVGVDAEPWYTDTVQSDWFTHPCVIPAGAVVADTGVFHALAGEKT
jgi:hypothetical protein